MLPKTRKRRAAILSQHFAGRYVHVVLRKTERWSAGEYKVTIIADIWNESAEAKRQAEAMKAAAAKRDAIEDSCITPGGQLIHVVPAKYNTLETTPLTEKVERSDKPLKFIYDIPSK